MGLLDNKGLKKVVDWIKSELNSIEIPNAGQPVWYFDDDMVSATSTIYIEPYYVSYVYEATVDKVSLWFDNGYFPNPVKEYKHRAAGRALNKYEWPSIFDMPWPDNEIPVFDEDRDYEIYIAGGRVVSVSDITPPVEEIIYTINCNENSYLKHKIREKIYDIYINDILCDYSGYGYEQSEHLNIGENTIKIKCLSRIDGFSLIDYIDFTNYNYLKVDCSKIKSNHFHIITKNLKIDEIIYPKGCIGDISSPVYDFEIGEIDLSFLSKNLLKFPKFNIITDNVYVSSHITIDGTAHIFRHSEMSNKNINNILCKSIYENKNAIFGEHSFENAKYLRTLGTKHESIHIDYGILPNNLYFANICTNDEIYVNTHIKNQFKNIKELILDSNINNPAMLSLIHPSYFNDIIIFVEYIDFKYSTFDINNNTTIYTYNDIPEDLIHTNIFIKVNDISEVPFQYAPATWDDVKNYDENGNVID